jgi:hypothetical protein
VLPVTVCEVWNYFRTTGRHPDWYTAELQTVPDIYGCAFSQL